MVTPASTAERALRNPARETSQRLKAHHRRQDKAYDTAITWPRCAGCVTPQLRRTTAPPEPVSDAQSIDARTPATSLQISQTCRKMAECIFGWGKQHGTMRKTKHRGIAAVSADFMLNLIAYNLVRIPKLIAA